MKGLRLVIVILILVGWSLAIFAQKPEGETKKNYLRWEAVEGAVSYTVQIKNADGNLVLDTRTDTSEHYFYLKPGIYRVRIGAVNRFEKVVSWSEWSSLVIKQPVRPVITSVEPDKLPSSSNLEVIIRGRNFEPGAGVEIKTGGDGFRIGKCRVKDNDLISCRIVTGTATDKSYSLVLTNPGGLSDSRDVTVYLPRPKESVSKGRIYLHGGYQFIQVLDEWQAPLNHSYLGFFVRSGVPFGMIPWLRGFRGLKFFNLEFEWSYARYSSRKRVGIVDSTLHQFLPGLYLSVFLPLIRPEFFLQVRAGGGLAWHMLVQDWTFGSPETSHSAEAMIGTGLALSYRWTSITVFAGFDYHLIFTGINLNHSIAYRTGVGYRF